MGAGVQNCLWWLLQRLVDLLRLPLQVPLGLLLLPALHVTSKPPPPQGATAGRKQQKPPPCSVHWYRDSLERLLALTAHDSKPENLDRSAARAADFLTI